MKVRCGKCDGRGRLSWTRLAEGRCFACSGTGVLVVNRAEHEAMLAGRDRADASRALDSAVEDVLDTGRVHPKTIEAALARLTALPSEQARAILVLYRDTLDLSGIYGARARAATRQAVAEICAAQRARRAA